MAFFNVEFFVTDCCRPTTYVPQHTHASAITQTSIAAAMPASSLSTAKMEQIAEGQNSLTKSAFCSAYLSQNPPPEPLSEYHTELVSLTNLGQQCLLGSF
jgi:hypothetical protein